MAISFESNLTNIDSWSMTDSIGDEIDSCDATCYDVDDIPEQIELNLISDTEGTHNLGIFYIDEYSKDLTTNSVSFSARALTDAEKMDRPASCVWQGASPQAILQELASANNKSVVYAFDSDVPSDYAAYDSYLVKGYQIAAREQKEPDSSFLYQLMKDYGALIKVYKDKIIAYYLHRLGLSICMTVTPTMVDADSISFSSRQNPSCTGCIGTYIPEGCNESVDTVAGSEGTRLRCENAALTGHDLYVMCVAMANFENMKDISLSFDLINPTFTAHLGAGVIVDGFDDAVDGNYYIYSIGWSWSGENIKQHLELYRYIKRIY